MEVEKFIIIALAVVIATVLILGAIVYTAKANEEVSFEPEEKRYASTHAASGDHVRFSVLESIKLGLGFGIGLALAGFLGMLISMFTLGAVFNSLFLNLVR